MMRIDNNGDQNKDDLMVVKIVRMMMFDSDVMKVTMVTV